MVEDIQKLLIAKAQELDAQRKAQGKGPLTRDEFVDLAGTTRHFLDRAFSDGGWAKLVDDARICPHPNAHGRFGDNDALLVKYHALVKEKKTIPLVKRFAAYVGISRGSVHRRFRRDGGILNAYRKWLIENEPDSPYLRLIPSESGNEESGVPSASQAQRAAPSPQRKTEHRRRIPVNRKDHDDIAHTMERVGKVFGFPTKWKPPVNLLRPDKKVFVSKNKTLDVAWEYAQKTWVPIEVQIGGSVPDLIYRFTQVHQWSHRLVVISSPDFAAEIEEAVAEYPFRDKMVILTPDDVLAATKDLDRLLQLRAKIFES